MCFSSVASFSLAGILATVGGIAVARSGSTRYRVLAAAPLIFAAQQAAEGEVWRTVARPDAATAQRFAVIAFLSVAMVVWPIFAALALRAGERERRRRIGLTVLAGCGIVAAICSAALMIRSTPTASVAGHSIRYETGLHTSSVLSGLLLLAYVVPAVGPFFVSSLRASRAIGATLLGSMFIAMLVERDALTSVWCFFAAILSVQLLFALDAERR